MISPSTTLGVTASAVFTVKGPTPLPLRVKKWPVAVTLELVVRACQVATAKPDVLRQHSGRMREPQPHSRQLPI